jgi:hypothetical protein
MLATLTKCAAAAFSPPLAELTSQGPPTRGNPTSLQLALIGAGTLLAYSLAKKLSDAREARRRTEVPRQALDAVSAAPAPAAPHFLDTPAAATSQSAEHAA